MSWRALEVLRRSSSVLRTAMAHSNAGVSLVEGRAAGLQRLSTTSSSDKASADVQAGVRLLQRWRELGHGNAFAQASPDQLRETLRAALGVHSAQAPGVTDELLQVVMRLYTVQQAPDRKAQFLKLVCEDFGVQGAPPLAAHHSLRAARGRLLT